MAKKATSSKHETELERLRNLNNWEELKRVVNIQLQKDTKNDQQLKFYLAEANLESYLVHNPLGSDSQTEDTVFTSEATKLDEVQRYLNASAANQNDRFYREINILQAKLHFFKNKYTDTFESLSRVQMEENYIKDLTTRQTQLFAEGCALKAICLEKLQEETSNNKQHNNIKTTQIMLNKNNKENNEIIRYYELACDKIIEHSQQMNKLIHDILKTSKGAQSIDVDTFEFMNPLYDITLEKVPTLYIKNGNIEIGLNKFRGFLMKHNLQSISHIFPSLLRKYSEFLVNNVCAGNYKPLNIQRNKDNQNAFAPTNLEEETLLSLMLAQRYSVKEVPLLRLDEYKRVRESTFAKATNALDYLIIYLSHRKCFALITEILESTIKYSFEQFHVWYQYGLSLMCSKKYERAYAVLKECHRMKPEHLQCTLLLSQLTVQYLFLTKDAIEWSEKAINLSKGTSTKAFILNGCAMLTKAQLQKQHNLKLKLYESALESFKKAYELDEYDFLPLYHVARTLALLRRINDSIEWVQKALKIRSDDKDALHLLSLLLTSTKNYEEAYTVILQASSQNEDYELLYTKARIEEYLYGFSKALNTFIYMILVYKRKLQSLDRNWPLMSNRQSNINNNDTISNFDNISFANLQNTLKLNEAIGKTIAVFMENDHLLSKAPIGTQQHSSSNTKSIESLLQIINILVQIGEFYLRHKHIADAESCCNEIRLLHPMSYSYMYLKGCICMAKQDFGQARAFFTSALSINPQHIKSLEQLSVALCYLNEYNLAESMTRDAIALQSSSIQLWSLLGRILEKLNDNESSMKCYETALKLEATDPIVSFTCLNKIL